MAFVRSVDAMNGTPARFVLGTVVLLLSAAALATEYQQDERIAADSAEETGAGLDTIDAAPEKRPARAWLGDQFSTLSPFWRDSELDFNVRAFDLDREDSRIVTREAFAIGTELTFRSGKFAERLSAVVSWHTSNGIDAPPDRGNTGLLAPDQSDLSVLSRAYLMYDLGESTHLRLYRHDFGLPYLNRQDSRMIPNTHEAYTVIQKTDRLQWVLGYVTRMKRRDSERFVPMGEIAGVPGSNAGTAVLGAGYNLSSSTTIGAALLSTDDLFTTTYAELIWKKSLNEDWGVQGGAQHTYQWSTGDELLGAFSTYSWGLRGVLSYRGAVLTAAYSQTGGSAIRKPFGGTPGFTSSMLYDFDRAGERAYRLGLSYNLERLGLDGTSFKIDYTSGSDARTDSGLALPESNEVSMTLDFRPERGLFKGAWIRIRYAERDRETPFDDRREVRLILNYNIEAWR